MLQKQSFCSIRKTDQLKITVNDRDELEKLSKLEPRQFMIAWTTAVKQYAQKKAREKIGGNFGSLIARDSILNACARSLTVTAAGSSVLARPGTG